MKGITAVGCAVIVALVACSLSPVEAKTDKLLVPPQAEKSQGNSPAELTKSVTEPESAIAENKNTGLSDGTGSVGQVKHILKKRDEISDYEGWENKKRK